MIKKILSVLLSISIILSYTAFVSAKKADSFPTEDKIEILKTLGMINEEYDELTIDDSKVFTRAEYADFAASTLAKGKTSNSLYFHDIPRENWAFEYVSVLVEEGLISVNEEKYFYPEEEMTLEEALEISLKALGYSTALDNQNIFSFADSVGITKGVQQSKGVNFTNTILILYNTLFSEVMEFQGNSYKQSEETYMEHRYSVILEQGIVECFNGVSINANYGNDDTYISGKEFTDSDISLYEYLGCEVVYLYEYNEKDDIRKLIWVKKLMDSDNELNLMYVENEVSFDSLTYQLSYFDGRKYKNIKLDKNVDVIYNDEYVISGVDKVLSDEFYSLKIIERDGEYVCLIVRDYENYVVGGIDTLAECIYDKGDNNPLALALADYVKIKSKTGKDLTFTDIKTDDVLSVYKSLSGERVEIVVCTDKVEGKITSASTDDFGCQWIGINDKAYRKAKINDIESLLVGSEVILYLDAYGYVAVVGDKGNSEILAYMIKPYFDEYEEKVYIKIYDKSGNIVKAECAEKLKINKGKVCKTPSETYSHLENYGKGLIIYKKNNDGLINNIQFATTDGTSGLNLRFKKENLRYRSTGNRMGQKMCLDNNTIIFGIPTDVRNASEDEFTVTNKAGLYGDMTYTVESYSFSENVGYEEILLIYDNDWNYKYGNSVGILVTEVTKRLNEDDVVVDCIIGWQGAQQVEKLCHESFSAFDGGIEKGDYITFNENKKNEVVSAQIQYDLSSGRRPKGKDMHVIEAISSGYVHEVNGNVAAVGIENGADFDMAYDFASGAVLIYDTKYNSVTQGSVKDLISYEVSTAHCDFLLVHMRYSKQLVYIIYR